MNFKQFLSEGRGKIELSYDDIVKQFKGDYSESLGLLTGPTQLYRGIIGVGMPAFKYQEADTDRKPLEGGEAYTHFLDSNPLNEGWPKRARSTICTTRVTKANHFGEVYVVFPKNGADVAALMVPDMWQVKNKYFISDGRDQQTMMRVGAIIDSLFKNSKLPAIDQLNQQIVDITSDPDFPYKVEETDLMNAEEAFSYKQLGAKLFSLKKLQQKTLKSTEIWFEGQSMMIRLKNMKEIQQFLIKDGLIEDGAF